MVWFSRVLVFGAFSIHMKPIIYFIRFMSNLLRIFFDFISDLQILVPCSYGVRGKLRRNNLIQPHDIVRLEHWVDCIGYATMILLGGGGPDEAFSEYDRTTA